MGKDTKIPWCDDTFNPRVGCRPVSPGCKNCFAKAWAKRSGHPELWGGRGENGERRRTKTWGGPVKWNREAEASGVRRRVFAGSLCDFFDNAVPTEWRDDAWALIRETPYLDWILLTKRIGNVVKMLPRYSGQHGLPSLPENVWLMITVVDQTEADRDVRKLLDIPATVHGVSVEPQLAPVSFNELIPEDEATIFNAYDNGLDWVITGPESGPHRRPYFERWARNLRDECQEAGVAFFYKQAFDADGNKIDLPLLDGRQWAEFPR